MCLGQKNTCKYDCIKKVDIYRTKKFKSGLINNQQLRHTRWGTVTDTEWLLLSPILKLLMWF